MFFIMIVSSCKLFEPSDIQRKKEEKLGEWNRIQRYDDIEISSSQSQDILNIYGELNGSIQLSGAINTEIDQIMRIPWAFFSPSGLYLFSNPAEQLDAPYLWINYSTDTIYSSVHMCYDFLTDDCDDFRPDNELDFTINFQTGEIRIPPTIYYNDDISDSVNVEGLFMLESIHLPAGESVLVETVEGAYSDLDPYIINLKTTNKACSKFIGSYKPGTYCGWWHITDGGLSLFSDDPEGISPYYEIYDLSGDTLTLEKRPHCTSPQYEYKHADFILAENSTILTCCETTRLVYAR